MAENIRGLTNYKIRITKILCIKTMNVIVITFDNGLIVVMTTKFRKVTNTKLLQTIISIIYALKKSQKPINSQTHQIMKLSSTCEILL